MPGPGPLIVFFLSFVTSLSGALMPGPLFTYTIARTLRTERGWLVGARVISGHAAIEALLVCGLALGVVGFLRAPVAAKIIGVAGAALLLYMGAGLIRETVAGKGMDMGGAGARDADGARDTDGAAGASPGAGTKRIPAGGGFMARLSPPVAGALVSMSNPYWWVWWVTVGAAFLVRFDIGFSTWPLLLAFFLGHELGDLGWYLAVSTVISVGRRSIPRSFVVWLLGACGLAIIVFGLWLGISPFLST
jgi:threonine/homoserine/homoserine lactone efflux protein